MIQTINTFIFIYSIYLFFIIITQKITFIKNQFNCEKRLKVFEDITNEYINNNIYSDTTFSDNIGGAAIEIGQTATNGFGSIKKSVFT